MHYRNATTLSKEHLALQHLILEILGEMRQSRMVREMELELELEMDPAASLATPSQHLHALGLVMKVDQVDLMEQAMALLVSLLAAIVLRLRLQTLEHQKGRPWTITTQGFRRHPWVPASLVIQESRIKRDPHQIFPSSSRRALVLTKRPMMLSRTSKTLTCQLSLRAITRSMPKVNPRSTSLSHLQIWCLFISPLPLECVFFASFELYNRYSFHFGHLDL